MADPTPLLERDRPVLCPPVEVAPRRPHDAQAAAPSQAVPDQRGPSQNTPGQVAETLADALGDIMQIDQVSVDSHFFEDLGADSMVMARFCARVSKRPDLPSVSMRDIYENSTIASLAAAVADVAPAPVVAASAAESVAVTADHRVPARRSQIAVCGTLQALFIIGYALPYSIVALRGLLWIVQSTSSVDMYVRAVVLTSGLFVVASIVPILAKWVLVGRWTAQPIRLWSLDYFRFWVVKTLIRSNPIVLLTGRSTTSSGSPILPLYLRALGAKVGRGVTILSAGVPVCTDLLTIGDHTVVRKDSQFSCYRARAGVIEPGRVTLGRHVVVGEATVLDINTTMHDGAQLGHASSLQAGQHVPAYTRYQGSPAQPTEVHYRTIGGVGGARRRRIVFTTYQLVVGFALAAPLSLVVFATVVRSVPVLAALTQIQPVQSSALGLVQAALLLSTVLMFGSIVVGLIVIGTVPRLLNRLLEPGRLYPLYGFHYVVHRTHRWHDERRVLQHLLRRQLLHRALPAVDRLRPGHGRADRVELRVRGQARVPVPDLGRQRNRCGRRSVGHERRLLQHGVPAGAGLDRFEQLPRQPHRLPGPRRDRGRLPAGHQGRRTGHGGDPGRGRPPRLAELPDPPQRRSGPSPRDRPQRGAASAPLLLGSKNRHNLVTMFLFLLVRWLLASVLFLVLIGVVAGYHSYGAWANLVGLVVTPPITVGYWALVDRTVARLQAHEPNGCSIYHRNFWRHERYWKIPAFRYIQAYNGTPFKTMVWRLLGVRVGAGVFDDGCLITEKALVEVGDNCALNAGCVLQAHSQEDGGFKSDRITIGSGCTIGVGALVHYGVTMGDDSTLAADSFLMKGQEVPPQTAWVGNPAQEAPK